MSQSPQQLLGLFAQMEVEGEDESKYVYRTAGRYTVLSLDAVRPKHALSLVEKPDALVVYEHDRARAFAATSLVRLRGRAAFVILVLGVEAGGAREIQSGFRLYADEAQLLAFSSSPSLAVATLLTRYGIPFHNSEGQSVLFEKELVVARTHGESGPEMLADLLAVMEVDIDEGRAINAMTKPLEDGRLRARWLFVFDLSAYGEVLRRFR